MVSVLLGALIAIVGSNTGSHPGMLVWTGTPLRLNAPRTVPGATAPLLSPNGRLVAYVAGGELQIQPVAGGPARTLTQVPGTAPAIAFSPTGVQMAFAAENAIILAPLVGKGPVRRVLLPRAWAGSTLAALAWSPDGRRLAFSRTSGNGKAGTLHNELDVIGVDGRGARTLAVNPAPYGARSEPVWSPDSTRIAFRLDEFRLATVPVTGGAPVPLTRPASGVVDDDPVWSPDGTGLRRLTTTPIPPRGVAHVGSKPLAWSPDGKSLLTFRHDHFSIVDVATRGSRTLKRTGIQYSLLGARWL